jgi:hypothetical protein
MRVAIELIGDLVASLPRDVRKDLVGTGGETADRAAAEGACGCHHGERFVCGRFLWRRFLSSRFGSRRGPLSGGSRGYSLLGFPRLTSGLS